MHTRFSHENERAQRHGQEHLFKFWYDLTDEEKLILLENSEKIDYGFINKLYDNCVASKKNPEVETFESPDIIYKYPYIQTHDLAIKEGIESIKRNEFALFLPAGGQGSRLGFNGPKGLFPATPVKKHPLFRVFAEKILAAQKKYDVQFDWYIMTSVENNDATINFFEQNNYFNLQKNQLYFFIQEALPSVDKDGKILMKSKHEVSFNPNGTGGIYSALERSGMIEIMKNKGIKYLSFFNVDNPLVIPIDVLQLGSHIITDSQVSLKAIEKKPSEKVGVIVKIAKKHKVIEYVNLSAEDAKKTTETGELFFKYANINIMILNVDYVEFVHKNKLIDFSIAALKKIPYIDSEGNLIVPEKPNAYKFEAFVFDPLPFAKRSIAFEVRREEEFAPIKNESGEDSPATAIILQTNLYKEWLITAGIKKEIVDKLKLVEISPLFAFDIYEFKYKLKNKIDYYNNLLDGKEEYYFE